MRTFIEEHRERFGVEPIFSTLEVSASAYYERRRGRRSARAISDERLLGRVAEIHERNYCAYGYRRMWIAPCSAHRHLGPHRVARRLRRRQRLGPLRPPLRRPRRTEHWDAAAWQGAAAAKAMLGEYPGTPPLPASGVISTGFASSMWGDTVFP